MSLTRWALAPVGAVLGFLVATVLYAAGLGFVAGLGVEAALGLLGYAWGVGVFGGVVGGVKVAGVA